MSSSATPCWERLKAEGEGDYRGWDGWMISPTQWMWVWASSGSWWWTGSPGVPQSMGSQKDTTERLNWTELQLSFILCRPLLLLPSVFPSIRVFFQWVTLLIRWLKDWSFNFSISPSNEYSELISFRMDWFDLLAVQGTLKSLLHQEPYIKKVPVSVYWDGPFNIRDHDIQHWHKLWHRCSGSGPLARCRDPSFGMKPNLPAVHLR